MTIGTRPVQTTKLKDVHYTKTFWKAFRQSLSAPIKELLICAPYFGKLPSPFQNIVAFCEFQLNRGVEQISIITPPPEKQQAFFIHRRCTEVSKKRSRTIYSNAPPFACQALSH